MGNHKLLQQITEAIAGLFWSSEADYPWQVVCLPENIDNLNNQTLLQYFGHPVNSQVITTSLESFLTPAMIDREWYGEAERGEAQRYRDLYQLLQINLNQIHVYLIGKIEIDIYVLGQTSEGRIVGISTKTVET